MKRRATAAALATVLAGVVAVPASAASPDNDDYADAAPIGALPFADDRDMANASTETAETVPACATNPDVPVPAVVGPAIGADLASVWYRFEPAGDATVTIDPRASDFTVIVGVYEGRDLLTQRQVGCARTDQHGVLTLDVAGGSSYSIQLVRFVSSQGTALSFTVAAATAATLPGVASIEPLEVLADDGTALRGHVYLPEGPGPFAPVLEYSPYWNTAYGPSEAFTQQDGARTTMAKWLRPVLDAGFAVALVNVRGTGESGGCMQWGGPLDWSDAATVVEALADEWWSTGEVGMYGLSYPGWTQMMAVASGAAPSLKAVVPASPVTDLYSLWNADGATKENLHARMPVFTASVVTGTRSVAFNQTGEPFVPDTEVAHVACPRYADDLEASPPAWNGDRTPYFQDRDLRSHIDGTDVAVFATVGLELFDGLPPDFEGHISQLDGVWDLLGGDRRFMLGQWPHGFPTHPGFHEMAVAWLDHHLRGGPEVVASGVVDYQDDSGAWHTATSWPPASTTETLWMSQDWLVDDATEVAPSARSFLSTDNVPCAGVCPRPAAVRIPECVGDHLVYVSEPLAEEIVVAGEFSVDLTVESDMVDGTLTSFLYHTSADDPCATGDLVESGRAITDLRHVFTEEGADFPVGVATDLSITSRALATRIPAGHRLVLTVGSASWDTEPDHHRPVLTVTTGAGAVSALRLPVVAGTVTG